MWKRSFSVVLKQIASVDHGISEKMEVHRVHNSSNIYPSESFGANFEIMERFCSKRVSTSFRGGRNRHKNKTILNSWDTLLGFATVRLRRQWNLLDSAQLPWYMYIYIYIYTYIYRERDLVYVRVRLVRTWRRLNNQKHLKCISAGSCLSVFRWTTVLVSVLVLV